MSDKVYPTTPPDLTPDPLDDEALLAIGRIVRGVAEIEHCADCFLTALMGMSDAQAHIMLARTGLRTKIEKSKHLCSLRTDHALRAHTAVFSKKLNDVIECRNAVSHGVYLGALKTKNLRF